MGPTPDLPCGCAHAGLPKARKQLALALRTLERAALLACRPKPKRISLNGHVFLAMVDEHQQRSSMTTTIDNLQILVHKG